MLLRSLFLPLNLSRPINNSSLIFQISRPKSSSSGDDREKPNLRTASRRNIDRRKKIVIGCAILAAIYMYPTIIKPLLGLDKDLKLRKAP